MNNKPKGRSKMQIANLMALLAKHVKCEKGDKTCKYILILALLYGVLSEGYTYLLLFL